MWKMNECMNENKNNNNNTKKLPSFKVFYAINSPIMFATLWIIPFNANI